MVQTKDKNKVIEIKSSVWVCDCVPAAPAAADPVVTEEVVVVVEVAAAAVLPRDVPVWFVTVN